MRELKCTKNNSLACSWAIAACERVEVGVLTLEYENAEVGHGASDRRARTRECVSCAPRPVRFCCTKNPSSEYPPGDLNAVAP